MRVDQDLSKIANDIDYQLRNGRFEQVPVHGDRYAAWYGRLLTTLTVAVGKMNLLYVQSDYDEQAKTARWVLFTGSRVIVVDVRDVEDDEAPVQTRILPRRAIESIDVAADMPIDAAGSASYAWPGQIQLSLSYSGLKKRIALRGPGVESHKVSEPGPIMRLLESLQEDLTP